MTHHCQSLMNVDKLEESQEISVSLQLSRVVSVNLSHSTSRFDKWRTCDSLVDVSVDSANNNNVVEVRDRRASGGHNVLALIPPP